MKPKCACPCTACIRAKWRQRFALSVRLCAAGNLETRWNGSRPCTVRTSRGPPYQYRLHGGVPGGASALSAVAALAKPWSRRTRWAMPMPWGLVELVAYA